MRIIGPASAPRWSITLPQGTHPRFAEMMGYLLDVAEQYAVDPIGVVAQSLKETGLGNFGGKVKPEFYNTCGLKNRHLGLYPGTDDDDQPLAHARFAYWDVGATAHVQHLRAYAGIDVRDLIVDPRYNLVDRERPCVDFADLGGRWNPSPTYGIEIENLALRITGRA